MAHEFDNNLIGVSRRYAKALIDVAQEKNMLEKVALELKTFNDLYSNSSDLKNVLNLPTVNVNEKKLILDEILGSFESNIVKDFLYLLADEARFNAFSTIFYCFEEELNLQKGVIEVEIKSVIELDDKQKTKLKEKLEQKTGKSVKMIYKISPEIIGGLIISYNGKTIDLSVNSKLEDLKKQLN